jgi:hypothetical protein
MQKTPTTNSEKYQILEIIVIFFLFNCYKTLNLLKIKKNKRV